MGRRARSAIVVMLALVAACGGDDRGGTTETLAPRVVSTTAPSSTLAITTPDISSAAIGSTNNSTTTPTSTTAVLVATTRPTAKTTTTTLPPLSGSITVLAATSLTNAFRAIEQAFETANPGVNVTMSFGGSSTLATQIQNGAPADVFASADVDNMTKVSGSLAGGYSIFATNFLQIMVAPGNPRDIRSLADLARTDVIVITAQPGVPIRSYTDDVLAKAGVVANFRSFEANVGGIVTKITGGAADAGIVYRTDVIAAGSKAQGVRIPPDQNLVAQYPIGVLAASVNRRAADAFVAFVNGPGQSLLASYGFGDG